MNVKNIHLLVISKYQKIRFYLISHTNWTFPQVVHIQTFDRDEETHLNPLALLGLVVCNSLEKMSSNSYAFFKQYPKQDFVPMTSRDQWTSAWLLTTTWATLAIWWCDGVRGEEGGKCIRTLSDSWHSHIIFNEVIISQFSSLTRLGKADSNSAESWAASEEGRDGWTGFSI